MVAAGRIKDVLEDMGFLAMDRRGNWPIPPESSREYAAVNWSSAGMARTKNQGAEIPTSALEELEAFATSGHDEQLSEVLDIWAWYAPIHFFGDQWGIYIRQEALLTLAGRIGGRLTKDKVTDQATAWDLLRSALYALYFHEAFHHYVESFAIRLELIENESRYEPYHNTVYRQSGGEGEPVEEALACAEMLRRERKEPGLKTLSVDVRRATRQMLKEWIPSLPDGYRNGVDLVEETSFKAAQNRLSSQIQTARRDSTDKELRWRLIRRDMYRGMCDCRSHTYLVGTGSPSSVGGLCLPASGAKSSGSR